MCLGTTKRRAESHMNCAYLPLSVPFSTCSYMGVCENHIFLYCELYFFFWFWSVIRFDKHGFHIGLQLIWWTARFFFGLLIGTFVAKPLFFDLSVNMQSFIVTHWKETGKPILDSTFQEVFSLLLFSWYLVTFVDSDQIILADSVLFKQLN